MNFRAVSNGWDLMNSRYAIKDFVDLMDTRREIRTTTLLPQTFWLAFERGIYPPSLSDRISYHVDNHAKLIEGLGFAHSLYLYGYEINFFVIEGVFFVSIFSLEPKSRLLGVIDYNLRRKKHEMCYLERWIDAHPVAASLLDKLRDELQARGIDLEARVSKGWVLPFIRPLKIIICSVRWNFLITHEPGLSLRDRAECVASDLQVGAVTAATYGNSSTFTAVRQEANKAYKVIMESRYEITSKWQAIKAKAPQTPPQDCAEQIGLELGIDPITVAGYAKYSPDKMVKSEAIKAYNILLEEKHEITGAWDKCIQDAPDLTPTEHVEQLSLDLEMAPLTIANLGRFSKNKRVRSEANQAFMSLRDTRLNLTPKWRALLASHPNLTPKERVDYLSVELQVSSVTVAGCGKHSPDKAVRSDAHKAYKMVLESNHEITRQWLELIDAQPDLAPHERAERIAAELGLDPLTVASYGTSSPNDKVKSEAYHAFYTLYKRKHSK